MPHSTLESDSFLFFRLEILRTDIAVAINITISKVESLGLWQGSLQRELFWYPNECKIKKLISDYLSFTVQQETKTIK